MNLEGSDAYYVISDKVPYFVSQALGLPQRFSNYSRSGGIFVQQHLTKQMAHKQTSQCVHVNNTKPKRILLHGSVWIKGAEATTTSSSNYCFLFFFVVFAYYLFGFLKQGFCCYQVHLTFSKMLEFYLLTLSLIVLQTSWASLFSLGYPWINESRGLSASSSLSCL